MANLLLEIGMEEIPAKFMPPALSQLKQLATDKLTESRIGFGAIETYGTPRRITLIIHDVADMQEDLLEEVKGPSVKAAFDAEGNPTKAALGFARGQGVEVTTLEQKEIEGGVYVFANKKTIGRKSSEVLAELLPQFILGLHFPKPMRWGYNETRYARPIRWIIGMLDSTVIPFDIEGVQSSNVTRGHRFLGSDHIEINNVDEYMTKLEENYVIVDQKRREEMIIEQAGALAEGVQGSVKIDEDLLEEVVYLVEYPTALMGNFDFKYLTMPQEVVITPMQEHQRYFPVLDSHKHLLPKFITVRNGNAEHLETVQKGNEKVLEARLSDAKFFYDEDLKVNFADHVEKLKSIVFQEKLGTIYEKVERIQKGTEEIADLLQVGDGVKERALRGAYLCKADLVTQVVYEFPELQGLMGEKYAYASGEHPLAAKAISEHYLPKNATDELPLTFEGVCVSLADKLDTIVGCFAVGIIPTGSQDPYGLRRQAAGICSMIVGRTILVELSQLIAQAIENYPAEIVGDKDQLLQTVYGLFEQRVRNILQEKGHRYDVIDAIITSGYDNLLEALMRADSLEQVKGSESFAKLITAFTRANNLAKKAESNVVQEQFLVEEVEKNLWAALQTAEATVADVTAKREFTAALEAIAQLEEPINAFFDGVMVMDNDENIKNNRLALLVRIAELVNPIADLTKVVQD